MFRCLNPGCVNVKGTLEETLRYARMGDFEGMDGALQKMRETADKIGVEGIKDLYAEQGLRVGAMSLPPKWRASEAEHKAIVDELPAMAKVAQELGATGCVTWLSPFSETLRFRDNFRFHVARLRPIAEILKDHGLRLAIEPVGPRTKREGEGYGFLYTQYGGLALAEAIGTGNVGLLLDSWHWYNALGTAADLASLTADDVVHVHINDAPADTPYEQQQDGVRALPGETGVIDLTTFLLALKKMGYQGAVTPEPMSAKLRSMSSEEAATAVGDALKRVWGAD
jgi:sugar phosphate isomerase/epimerase